MTIYIALLRGINVGGNNKIKMSELKTCFEALGFGRVKTYINSGNILFESEEGEAALRQQIEQMIHKDFRISLTVVLRSAAELEQLIASCPYDAAALSEGESIHASLLTEPLAKEKINHLSDIKSEQDQFQIKGRDIYMWLRQSMRDSKLAGSLTKLGNTVTTRNWNTIIKLDALAKEMHA
ncbi:DUF1697 domain-containing protein [Paenibacillus agricola]|uniref:DUF1697 domain-containing protein n=1 Tax=Paenibacillus agricola TaxID=2716264 RepID=A0ABX0J2U2_9BACL|nr:DUF1697 domain-containing protein [Paenibacillus agricola]NHN28284.1 DUF1697 domain-containing protein [Paenibacillus agricola]